MRIDTTFDLGQTVYGIANTSVAVWVPCEFCDAQGTIVGANGKARSCPECFTRQGHEVRQPTAWRVQGAFTVGQVRVEVTRSRGLDGEELFDNFKAQEGRKESYMLIETGVGSGTVHRVASLFATRDEAEAACAELNAAGVEA